MSRTKLNRKSRASNWWGDVAGREAPKLLTVLASEPCSIPFSSRACGIERSRNPYCTAVFCTVPRNRIFFSPLKSSSVQIRDQKSKIRNESTFPSQPIDLTFLTLFNLQILPHTRTPNLKLTTPQFASAMVFYMGEQYCGGLGKPKNLKLALRRASQVPVFTIFTPKKFLPSF